MDPKTRRIIRRTQRAARNQREVYGLNAIRIPMVPGIQVHDPLPGMSGPVAADPASGRIYSDGAMDRFTAGHESAHLLEKYMTDGDKRRFTKVMGIPNREWEIGDSGALVSSRQSQGYRLSAAEVFADMTALLAAQYDPEGNRVYGAYLDKMPSRKRLRRFGRALERFGDRNDLPRYVRPRRGGVDA